ncbi:MAG: hypothetical protein AAF512_20530, partial [Pseudomonadota bacterium]
AGGLLAGSPMTLGITIQDNDSCTAGTKGVGVDLNNNLMPVPTTTCFVSQLDGMEAPMPSILSETNSHRLAIRVDVGPEHQGMPADLLILGGLRKPGEENFSFYARSSTGWILDNSGELPTPVSRMDALPDSLELLIHDGPLAGFPGEFIVYGGYQLDDGTLVFNGAGPYIWNVE